jgi:translation initiation factor eIF-2B subunit gamma
MIGESTKVEERTTIKKSIIGKHCIIGKMAKIVGCVILDHCVIGDGYACCRFCAGRTQRSRRAKLESCLIGKNTKIGAKADLSRCATQAGYEVEAAGRTFDPNPRSASHILSQKPSRMRN